MQSLGTGFILVGLVVATLAQVLGAALAFKTNVVHGILSLVVPGYMLVIAKRHGFYGLLVGTWFAGVVAAVVGTVLLT
jgi:hypothetical protein